MRRCFLGFGAALALCMGCGAGALPSDDVTGGHGGTTGVAGTLGGAGAGGAAGTPVPVCPHVNAAAGVFNYCGRTYSIAFSPDGQLLATGTQNARPNAHMWRLSDGAHLRDIDAAGETAYHVEFSPDGTLLATAGGYTETGGALNTPPEIVKLWNVADGSLVRTIPARCGSYASTASFSHDGTLLVTAGERGPVEIWRVSDGGQVTSISYPTSVHNAHFSPDDTRVLVAGVDRHATVWSLPDASLVLTMEGTADEMADAVYSADGSEIVTTGANNSIALWDALTGALHQTMAGHETYVSHIIWIGPDRLVSNDWVGTVKSWTRSAGSDFASSGTWTTGGQSLGMAVSPDGKLLVAGGVDALAGVDGFVFLPL